ncbi:MAG TPA: chemotaxis protein CheW [Planctomycetota bacterium]|nr:chemotaxis protein CheW [Planctomycetota bacterium]
MDASIPDPQSLAEAGARRSAALKAGATAEAERSFIRFELAGERYCVPLECVTKIERVPPIIPVPRTPPFVRGIVSLRGEIVTVVDLAAVIGGEPVTTASHGLLVLADGPRRVGILSDALPDYFRIGVSQLLPAPTGKAGDALISNAIERKEGTVAVLDVKKLMEVLARRSDA